MTLLLGQHTIHEGASILRVVPEDHLSDEGGAQNLKLFEKKLGPNCQFDLDVTDEILSTGRGKHRYVVSEIELLRNQIVGRRIRSWIRRQHDEV